MIHAFVRENAPGADTVLVNTPRQTDWQGQRVMCPLHQIRGRGMRPLVPSEASLLRVMVPVQQVKKVKRLAVPVRHHISGKFVFGVGFPVLHSGTFSLFAGRQVGKE